MTATGSTEPTSIGRYELSSTLGIGGFATVHRAHDPALDGDVAVKVLLPQFVHNHDIRHRFVQEARLLRRVDSPNLVRVYDIGELEDRRPYFVMELADGGVLTNRLKSRAGRAIGRESLTQVIDALAGGLSALHAADIVHRDIKPDNLLIAGGGHAEATQVGLAMLADGERLLIGDLGLAKDHQQTSAGPTVSGGTPFYRPPEQMTPGAPITPAADIYAATAVVWFLLTGSHPPETAAIPAQLAAMPAAWQPLLERGLEHDPTLRYAAIEEWAIEARHAIDAAPETGVDPVTIGESTSLCPYKGMAAFQPEDAGLYFGRVDMIDTLVARLQDHSVVVIGGPSGSGKSSLLRAGLIPRLGRGAIAGSQQWRVALFNPGSDAVGELVHQLRRIRAAASPSLIDPASGNGPTGAGPLRSGTATGAGSNEELTRFDLPHGARRWLDEGPSTLLAIDQFEELFTLNPNRTDQELFVETLATMTESEHSRIKVAIALRADFYGVCSTYPWLGDRINESQLLVGPMSRQELRDAITMPAQRAGLRLESGLADAILDDVGGGGAASGGALPLLGHALMETWIRRRGSQMTVEGYQAAGGVSGAIAQRAEEVFTQLSAREQDASRRLLLQLINPGEGTPDTRRRVKRLALGGIDDLSEVLEKLAAARLLTVDNEAVEVVHEALIQSWPRLRTWVDENRESLQTRRRIGAAAAEWCAEERNPDLLYRGTQLAGALEWLEEHPDELDPAGDEFLFTAGEVRDRAEQERSEVEARGRRNRRLAIGALALLTIAAVIASAVAFSALGNSRANEKDAEAQQVQALAAAAAANASDQPLLATGLALESIVRADPSTAAARAALVEARVGLDSNRSLPQPFGRPVDVGDMQAVAITPDAKRFITGGRGGEVVFWDTVSRTEVQRFDETHESGVKALAVSNDGRWMVSTGDFTAILWDLTAAEPKPFELHKMEKISGRTIWDVAFSEDGSLVGLATESSVLVFDRASRNQISVGLDGQRFDILSVDFLDRERMVVGDGVGNLWIIDVATGEPIGEPVLAGDNGNDVWEVVFDREQNLVITRSTDNTVKSWSIESGRLQLQATMMDESVPGPQGVVPVLGGTELLVGAADGRLHRIDPFTGEPIPTSSSAHLHADRVKAVAVSQNGWIVSLGDDQQVQVWRHIGQMALVDEVEAEVDAIRDLAVSPGATRLAAATDGGTTVHDAATGALLHRLPGAVESLAFVSDSTLVTASGSGLLQLWDISRGVLLAENAGHGEQPVRAMAASPDGRLVATGGADGTVVIWSSDTLEQQRILGRHHGKVVTAVDFTPDGGTVVSIGWDQELRFSPVDGGEGRTVAVDQDGPQTVAVHPGGEVIAIGASFEKIDIVDFDGKLLRSMAPHPGGVWEVAFSVDGLSVVGTSRETGEVQLWDWATVERLGPAFGKDYGRGETDVVVGPNGEIWTGGLDGLIRRLDVLDMRVGCEVSKDVMDAGLRQQFLLGEQLDSCR